MKVSRFSMFWIAGVTLSASCALAVDKVVVIPLSGSSSVAGQSCSPGKYVSGFDANGDIICKYPPKYVFVTARTYDGGLFGINGIDKIICQKEANAASLGGVYKAWISDVDSGPAVNFTRHNGEYITTTGVVVANGWADLTDGSLQNPINITAAGNEHNVYVWSNTQTDGSILTFDTHCSNWSSTSSTSSGRVGWSGTTTNNWTESRAFTCDQAKAIYCFQQ